MSWARAYAKSEIREGDNWAKAEGRGSVKSDDLRTERSLSYDFAGCVDRNTEIAYDIHLRRRQP